MLFKIVLTLTLKYVLLLLKNLLGALDMIIAVDGTDYAVRADKGTVVTGTLLLVDVNLLVINEDGGDDSAVVLRDV